MTTEQATSEQTNVPVGLWVVITCPHGDPIHNFFHSEFFAREWADKSRTGIVQFWPQSTVPAGTWRDYGYLAVERNPI